MSFCQVIVDIASEDVDRVFTYRVPKGMALEPGMRVHVPFGRMQRLEGIVVEMVEDCDLPASRVRDVTDTLEDYPAVLPGLLELAQQIKASSFCTLAQALRLMFPAQMRGERISAKKREYAVLTVDPTVREQIAVSQSRAPKRAQVLRALMSAEGGELPVEQLRRELGDCRPMLAALCKMGYVRLEQRETMRSPYGAMEKLAANDPQLTAQQQEVLSRLLPAVEAGRGAFLLYGVTGSGKTEVFIRAVRRAAQLGKTAIVLVPEIALTPQMVMWFRSRFGEDAAVLHSRLSPGERYDEWRRIRRGDVRVVIGARSAIFAPLENIGLIIVDEEHEQSYIADNTPRYDARELARLRCEREGAALLLASATPSMRSFAMAGRGDLALLEMLRRVNDRPMPQVHIVDMREELKAGNRSVFSGALLGGLKSCLDAGKQAILFVNRRGYSTFVSCRSCGYVVTCSQCDVSMTYHSSERVLRCHYCGQEAPVPSACPECGSPYIKYFGVGTQRVEEEVRRHFPDVPVLRMDNDTTRTKDAHETLLSAFRRGEARILVGTQMIAKGLDFPNVTMVGIIAADAMLKLPDYRSAERTFQLLTQVAGRAGRADSPGEVYLQTYDPEHYAVEAASRQDYRAFYEEEMRRRKRALYPPYTLIARLLYEADRDEDAQREAQSAMRQMEAFFERRTYLRKYVVALRVMACPIRKIKGKARWEVTLKIVDKPICQEAVGKMSEIAQIPLENVSCICQVNPSSMM
ncbi:MAG: primosomal protein N' [Clostridiales bacterium]|nr:primosomal protein N' [Clostridiales bacterium]